MFIVRNYMTVLRTICDIMALRWMTLKFIYVFLDVMEARIKIS